MPPASFRFHLTMNTLALGYVIPAIRAYSGLAPVRQCSCRAYTNKGEQPVFGRSPLFVVFILITSHDCQNGFACISPLQRFIAPSKDLKKAFFYLSVSPARKDFFRKPTRPSLPLRKAPPLISVFSPQARRRKPPYSVLRTATL